MTHITFVKKILSSGKLCIHCSKVAEQLEYDSLIETIDQIVIADEREADSPGMHLARTHQVKRVPFFIVVDSVGQTLTFDEYSNFKNYLRQSEQKPSQ